MERFYHHETAKMSQPSTYRMMPREGCTQFLIFRLKTDMINVSFDNSKFQMRKSEISPQTLRLLTTIILGRVKTIFNP